MGGVEIIFGLIGLAIHVFIIYVCVNLAESKGYNTVFAALAGLFFGLWAVLVYAIMGNNNARVGSSDSGDSYGIAPKNIAPAPARTCWSCNSPIAGSPAVCQSCGVRLNY